jgi:hypothetical protein
VGISSTGIIFEPYDGIHNSSKRSAKIPFQMPDPGGQNQGTIRIRLRVPFSELLQVTIQRTSIPDAAGFAPTSGTL